MLGTVGGPTPVETEGLYLISVPTMKPPLRVATLTVKIELCGGRAEDIVYTI